MTYENDTPAALWLKKIARARKREKHYVSRAKRVTQLYEAEIDPKVNSYNILYSNTQTLLPSFYTHIPRPEVQRRFKDDDPLGKAAEQLLNRGLDYLLKRTTGDYEAMHDLMKTAVLSALVPGRGVTRFKYDATFKETSPAPKVADSVANPGDEDEENYESEDLAVPPEQDSGKEVVHEAICAEDWAYCDVVYGPARRWKDLQWLAYEHDMTESDVKANFPDFSGRKDLGYAKPEEDEGLGRRGKDDGSQNISGTGDAVVRVHEVWSKADRMVYFIAEGYTDGFLAKYEDPLELTTFWPQPKPLQFNQKLTTLTPTPPYVFYEEQAKELNRLSMRINRVMEAIKVRGFYDSQLKELVNLLNKEDNTLLPTTNAAAVDGDLGRRIWTMPLDQLIAVLVQLYQARSQCKQTIYEIMGLSDILRGSSVASETATAQNIKNQWGSLRIKDPQMEVQSYIRDCLQIMAELMVGKLSPATIKEMTFMPGVVDAAAKTQAQGLVQQWQQQQMMQAPMQAPPPGPPGAPPQQAPQPAPPPPEVQQAMQTAQAISWEEILDFLKKDRLTSYKIDIETNSTLDVRATEEHQDIQELFGSIAALVQAIGPAVQAGAIPMGVFRELLKVIGKRYSFGSSFEDLLATIPNQMPPPPQPPAAQGKDPQVIAMEKDLAMTKGQQEQQKLQLQMASEQQEHSFNMQELDAKAKTSALDHHYKQQQTIAKTKSANFALMADHAAKSMDLQHTAQKHQQSMAQGAQSHQADLFQSGESHAQAAAQSAQTHAQGQTQDSEVHAQGQHQADTSHRQSLFHADQSHSQQQTQNRESGMQKLAQAAAQSGAKQSGPTPAPASGHPASVIDLSPINKLAESLVQMIGVMEKAVVQGGRPQAAQKRKLVNLIHEFDESGRHIKSIPVYEE